MIGRPIDTLAWQRALVSPAITITAFEPERDTLRVVAQAAFVRCAIPVRMLVRVSRQWHDVFEFEIDPHPIKTGGAAMARVVKLFTEHVTGLAYQTAVARAAHELRRVLDRRGAR